MTPVSSSPLARTVFSPLFVAAAAAPVAFALAIMATVLTARPLSLALVGGALGTVAGVLVLTSRYGRYYASLNAAASALAAGGAVVEARGRSGFGAPVMRARFADGREAIVAPVVELASDRIVGRTGFAIRVAGGTPRDLGTGAIEARRSVEAALAEAPASA